MATLVLDQAFEPRFARPLARAAVRQAGLALYGFIRKRGPLLLLLAAMVPFGRSMIWAAGLVLGG